MKPEENGSNSNRRIILATSAVSLLLGVVVGLMFELDNHGHLHPLSLTGEGLLIDALLILSLLLIVTFVMRISAGVRPIHLVTAGTFLVISAIIGPAFLLRISSGLKTDVQVRRTFVVAAIVEFIGACCLGSGLRGIVNNRSKVSAARKEEEKE